MTMRAKNKKTNTQNKIKLNIKVSPHFKFLYDDNKMSNIREVFLRGGRAGGKSHEMGQYFIYQSLRKPKSRRVVFRETQAEVKSLKDLFLDIMEMMFANDNGLNENASFNDTWEEVNSTFDPDKIIKIKNTEINFSNGSKIILSFINDEVASRRKSMNGVEEAWIEEARFLTEYTHRLLKPTIRAGVARLYYTYNPLWKDDYIYNLANDYKGLERYIVKKINCYDNPFCPDVMLEDMREDFEKYPRAKAEQIWLGKPYENLDDCLFTKEIINKIKIDDYSFDREKFLRIVVALDPATTSNANKENSDKVVSNESGIAVLGITKAGIVELIDDLSGRHNPNEMARQVSSAYHKYDADCVVVETNQGGDLLKYTILGFDNSLKVKGVWAINDKVRRALPVANEAYMDKIKIPRKFKEMFKQMERMTYKGYLGARGESPDRLDAFVWGVYELLGISDYTTQGTLFKQSMLKDEIQGLIKIDRALFLYEKEGEVGAIDFSLYDCLSKDKFLIKDAFIFETKDLQEKIKEYSNKDYKIFLNDNIELDFGFNINYYNSIKDDIDLVAQETKNKMQGRVNLENCKENKYNGFYGNLLLQELLRFKTGEKTGNCLFYCFCAMILN